MTEHITAKLARLESQVEWWRDQAQQVERDRSNLRYVLPVGLVAGALGVYVRPLVGIGLLALTAVIWGMGLYMTTVRRTEFRENLREAQTDLRDAEADIRVQRDKP